MTKKHSEATAPVDIDSGSVEYEIDKSELTVTITWNGIEDYEWGTDENGEQITATADNCKYVISWCPDGSDYNLEGDSKDVPWDACYAKDQVEHTITELLTGRLYNYGIVAVNGNDEYNTSDANKGTFEIIEPTPPTGVDGDSIEHEIDESELTVTFTWNGIEDYEWGTDENGEQIDPATAGNCKYVVTWYISGTEAGSGEVPWDACPATEEYTTPELLADTKYDYKVEAVNGNDDGYNRSDARSYEFRTPKAKTEDL